MALLGPNGAGKSTLMKRSRAWSAPRAGRVTFDGQRIDGAARPPTRGPRHRPRAGAPPALPVPDRARQPAARRPHPPRARVARTRRCAASSASSRCCGARATQLAHSLSGGEQQMCAIARGPDGAPAPAHDRRAVPRSGAPGRRADQRPPAAHPRRGGHHRRVHRAERRAGSPPGGPRLHPRVGPHHPATGGRPTSCSRPRCGGSSSAPRRAPRSERATNPRGRFSEPCRSDPPSGLPPTAAPCRGHGTRGVGFQRVAVAAFALRPGRRGSRKTAARELPCMCQQSC